MIGEHIWVEAWFAKEIHNDVDGKRGASVAQLASRLDVTWGHRDA